MLSLKHAAKRSAQGRQPLPEVWPSLTARTAVIRRSQVTMIAGDPGSGKTAMAVVYAVKVGVPTLYIAADTDEATMVARFGAAITGHQTDAVEKALATEDGSVYYLDQLVTACPNLRLSLTPSPGLEDICEEIEAYDEVWGEPPHLVIVDTLYDVAGDAANEWAEMKAATKDFRHLARRTKAAIVVLHHTNEEGGSPKDDEEDTTFMPPPRRRIAGRLSQAPEMILTCACEEDGNTFRVAVVKNRSGKCDRRARNPLTWYADMSRMVIDDQRYRDGSRW